MRIWVLCARALKFQAAARKRRMAVYHSHKILKYLPSCYYLRLGVLWARALKFQAAARKRRMAVYHSLQSRYY